MPYFFYIARCVDNSLYIGSSDNPSRRIIEHNSGIGAQWTKQHGKANIIYTEEYPTYLEAHSRELQVKKWSRVKKEHLIQGIKP
jgi:putative endonuclease